MLNVGAQELLVILAIALIVVGPAKLPELARSLGKGLRELRKVQDDVKDMVRLDLDTEPDRPARAPARPAKPRIGGGPGATTDDGDDATPAAEDDGPGPDAAGTDPEIRAHEADPSANGASDERDPVTGPSSDPT
jgi:sec-independent protein translocase protein TatB